ncbi:hypothetical protein Bpfe_006356, partial [Biomphalaria pfeifferi]
DGIKGKKTFLSSASLRYEMNREKEANTGEKILVNSVNPKLSSVPDDGPRHGACVRAFDNVLTH